MMGLRKVVELRVYDMPSGMVINKDNNSYQFYWKNAYYIGNTEIYKSKLYNNITKKPLLCNRCDNDYLNKMIYNIASKDSNPDNNIVEDDELLFYAGGESKIYYFGKDKANIKQKIFKR